MAMQRSTAVGVFDDRAQAEKAIEALYNAGIPADQIRYSHDISSSSGLLANIKNLFSGQDRSGEAVANDLTGMGLTQEEAHYYALRYEAGLTIVAVQSSRNMPNALSILRACGAHEYNQQTGVGGRGVTGGVTQQSNDARTAPIRTGDATAAPSTGQGAFMGGSGTTQRPAGQNRAAQSSSMGTGNTMNQSSGQAMPAQNDPSFASGAAQSPPYNQGMAAQRDPSFTGDMYNQGMAAQRDPSFTGGSAQPSYDQTTEQAGGAYRQDREVQPDSNRSADDRPRSTEWRDTPPASSQRTADWGAQSSSNTGRQEANRPPMYGDPDINPDATSNRTGDPGSGSGQDVQKGAGMRSVEQDIRDSSGRRKDADPDIQRRHSDADQDFQSGQSRPDENDPDRRGMFDRGV
jgi:hypothetical protein